MTVLWEDRPCILVRGIAYLPQVDEKYEGTFLTISDLTPDKISAMKGLPVYIEHSEPPAGHAVGEVFNAYLNDDNWLMVELVVQGVTREVHASIDYSLRHNMFKMLSVGHDVVITRDPITVIEKRVKEISIVQQGAHDGTFITSVLPCDNLAQALNLINMTANKP